MNTASDATLRPWRRASGLVSVVQTAAMAGAIWLVFFGRGSVHGWAFVAATVVVLLELLQFVLARAALRRVPDSFEAQVYRSLPLDRRDRRIVLLGLVNGPVAVIFLLWAMPEDSFFKDNLGSAALVLVAATAPAFLSLRRVWQNNTWLAISRIPPRPRQSRPRLAADLAVDSADERAHLASCQELDRLAGLGHGGVLERDIAEDDDEDDLSL